MSYSFWEDYQERNTEPSPTKDCIKTYYKVYKDGLLLRGGIMARQQILTQKGYSKSKRKRYSN